MSILNEYCLVKRNTTHEATLGSLSLHMGVHKLIAMLCSLDRTTLQRQFSFSFSRLRYSFIKRTHYFFVHDEWSSAPL